MNDKITMTRLAAMLAISSGKQKKPCEDFLRELFAIVEEELTKGENVRIKGFGTFKIVEVEPRKSVNVANGEETLIPGHNKVLFVAAKELASRVNLPFEAFEAVEIADELPTDSLEGEEEPADVSSDSLTEEEHAVESEPEFGVESEPKLEAESEPVQQHEEYNGDKICDQVVSDSELKDGSNDEAIEDEATVDAYSDSVQDNGVQEYTQEYSEEYVPQKRRHKFVKGFVAGFITALIGGGIVFAIGYLLGFSFGMTKGEYVAEKSSSEMVKAEKVSTDSVASSQSSIEESALSDNDKVSNNSDKGDDVPTKVSDEPVYDTVTTTRYLTTIAKDHYGNFNLWPIIYEENKDILGHPDRIRPGTKVIVPPLSKYGVDPKNVSQIKEIKQKGIDIYSRFK